MNQREMSEIWALADRLTEARKKNAMAQTAMLERQKEAQEGNWFGPTLQGAISGGLTGLMASGGNPLGALAGVGIGAGVGLVGHKQFNQNPQIMPLLGQAGMAAGGMYARQQALGMGRGMGDTTGRSLSLTGVPGGAPQPGLAPIGSTGPSDESWALSNRADPLMGTDFGSNAQEGFDPYQTVSAYENAGYRDPGAVQDTLDTNGNNRFTLRMPRF
jgi:hypothetical protein